MGVALNPHRLRRHSVTPPARAEIFLPVRLIQPLAEPHLEIQKYSRHMIRKEKVLLLRSTLELST